MTEIDKRALALRMASYFDCLAGDAVEADTNLSVREARALAAILREAVEGGWRPIASAPRDGTHIIARLHREETDDVDDLRWKAFSEIREIWFKPYRQLGMDLPWHAGDPFGTFDGIGSDHMGEGVPTHWRPLPPPPAEDGK